MNRITRGDLFREELSEHGILDDLSNFASSKTFVIRLIMRYRMELYYELILWCDISKIWHILNMALQYEGLYCIVQFFFSCRSHGARSGVTLNYPMTFAGRNQSPKMKYKFFYEKLIILCDLSQTYNMKICFVFFIIVDYFYFT